MPQAHNKESIRETKSSLKCLQFPVHQQLSEHLEHIISVVKKLPLEIKEINQEVKHWLKTSLAIIGERSRPKSHQKLNQLFLTLYVGGIWFGAQGPDLRGACGGAVGCGALSLCSGR